MKLPEITDSEFTLLSMSLRIAAEQYGRDAFDAGRFNSHLADQFSRQQREAFALAEKIEWAEP